MTDLKIGINLFSQSTSWRDFLDAARRVDQLGYESLWTWDHIHAIMGDPLHPIFEAYVTLGAWAMATERVKLGLMVGANTFRNPGIVAKSIATLDHASNGRAVLGIGAAWFEYEHRAHGIDFGTSAGERLDWLDESVGALRTLLDGGEVTSAAGEHYAFDGLRHQPAPVQSHVPIMIGGNGRTKTLRTTAKYADIWNGFGTPEELTDLDGVLRDHGAAVGRDTSRITRTSNLWIVIRDDPAEARRVWAAQMANNGSEVDEAALAQDRPILGPPERVAARMRQYVDAGFETALVELPAPYDVETLERLIGEVKPLVDAG